MTSPPPANGVLRRFADRVRGMLGLPITLSAPPPSGAGSPPPRRIADRVRDTFSDVPPWPDPDGPQTPLQVQVHADPDEVSGLSLPAKGDGYPFVFDIRCDWYAQASIIDSSMEAETEYRLRSRIAQLRTRIADRVTDEIRPVARQYEPHEAAALEAALARRLAGCFDEGEVQCTTRVRVDVCDEVRAMLAAASSDLIRLDAEGRYHSARIAQLRMLREQWEELFLDALRGAGEVDPARTTWMAPYALKLAEMPKDATRQLQNMLEERRSQTVQLFSDLDSILEPHQQGELDHVSFMMSSEHIFRQLLINMGLPVPPKSEGPSEHSSEKQSA
ncbi:hypothetical protein [Streptomonospora litoralis]|uniref:Uncharacterized protein n=1 Tax=Streptomonospora litoralis TaxID=2498135 RepID=A0A4P6PZN2_9ACTN|nr:hypothetical protein [Streptomonospora litoralis]QBI53613.1 hypothetical protein EKD16_09095 [Streptomonospora litoralis]